MLSRDVAQRLSEFASLDHLSEMPVREARELNDREAVVMFGQVDEVAKVRDETIEARFECGLTSPRRPSTARSSTSTAAAGWSGASTSMTASRAICAVTPAAPRPVMTRRSCAPSRPLGNDLARSSVLDDSQDDSQQCGPRRRTTDVSGFVRSVFDLERMPANAGGR